MRSEMMYSGPVTGNGKTDQFLDSFPLADYPTVTQELGLRRTVNPSVCEENHAYVAWENPTDRYRR